MPFTQFEQLYLWLCVLAFFVCLISLVFLRTKFKSKTQFPLTIMTVAIMGWLLCYFLATIFEQYLVFVKFSRITSYLFSLFFSTSFFYFSRTFTSHRVKWRTFFWLWPVLSGLILMISAWLGQPMVIFEMVQVPGVGYRAIGHQSLTVELILLANYAIAMLAAIRLIYALFKVNPHFQRTATVLIFLLIAPILYSFTQGLINFTHLNTFEFTPHLMAINVAALLYFIWKTKIKNLNILSRDKFFNDFLDGAIIVDANGIIFDINDSATKMIGELHQKDLLRKNLKDYFPFDQLTERHPPQDEKRADFIWISPAQQEFEIYSRPLLDPDQEIFGRMITFVDVTDLNKLLRQTHELSIRDTLTSAFNRRHFEAMTAKTFANAVRYGAPISIMMIDINNFKHINDAYGHLSGDKVLIKAADNFYQEMREADTIARYGGDEFVILMPNTPLQGAILAAQRIVHRCRVTNFNFVDETNLLSVSIGLSSWFSKPGENAPSSHESLLNQADQALYYAKNSATVHMAYYESGTFRIIPPLKLEKPQGE